MFVVAIIVAWFKALCAKLPKRKPLTKEQRVKRNVQRAKRIAQGMKHFEKLVRFLAIVFATLWIGLIIVIKHLLATIWRFK